jgi:hypothetical protein
MGNFTKYEINGSEKPLHFRFQIMEKSQLQNVTVFDAGMLIVITIQK